MHSAEVAENFIVLAALSASIPSLLQQGARRWKCGGDRAGRFLLHFPETGVPPMFGELLIGKQGTVPRSLASSFPCVLPAVALAALHCTLLEQQILRKRTTRVIPVASPSAPLNCTPSQSIALRLHSSPLHDTALHTDFDLLALAFQLPPAHNFVCTES